MAVTRAIALVIVVGNALILQRDVHWGAMLTWCQAHQAYVGPPLPTPRRDRGGDGGGQTGGDGWAVVDEDGEYNDEAVDSDGSEGSDFPMTELMRSLQSLEIG